ncbi:MAG: tetratricopeptide repeat protein [Pirellulaceae bacterium]
MQRPVTLLAIFTLSLVAAVSPALAQPVPDVLVASVDAPYYDLGGLHYQVSTDKGPAQTWFDRGLAMCFAFNHEEAVRCFERALEADPGFSMALWGMAYAWGPNINNREIDPNQIAQASLAVRLAELQAAQATPLERHLIAALAKRYTTPVPEDRGPLNRGYSDAMRDVYRQYPEDSLVAALFAESLMILRPWQHWSPDGQPAPETPELIAVLESALARWPDHPALCHAYIHAMEASPTPEKALPAANRLRNAMPGAGHLVHMPSHIDVLLGDYDQVITMNQKAIAADNEFVKREGVHNFYTLYRVHCYHFLAYGAMFDGQSQLALQAARDVVNQIPTEMLQQQTDFLDAFIPTPLHVLIRFGRWEDILNEPEPASYLPVTRCLWHYARGLAYAATGRVEPAEAERQLFQSLLPTVPESSALFNNPSRNILGVAEAMIAGEIAYRRGDYEQAFEHLREAVRRDDALNYDEPWGWMQPARHALGALLLEQGHVDEAEAVYRADLKRHPNNIWALQGLVECLDKQDRASEVTEYRAQFQKAAVRADVAVDRSCYCRQGQAANQK